ncbi:MAG: sigma-54 dependent transcriptional regulator [Bryobacteraceae bacterium]
MNSNRVLWIGGASHWPVDWPACPPAWNIDFLPPGLALERLPHALCDVLVLEFPAAGWAPDELLEHAQSLAAGVPALIRAPRASLADALRWGRLGAWQFLECGERAAFQIAAAMEAGGARLLAESLEEEPWRRRLLGDSHPMRQVCHAIRMLGGRRATVLLTGETGVGKEIAGRALHMAGPRSRGPFVAVNCGAIPETLLEDELFGHVRGAFTGAVQARVGRFEQAHGGVLFLDEIGDMPLALQPKLLRVLQEREFQRLGSSENVRVDIRVIAAANCDLMERIAEGLFREDLYYRLCVAPIHIPPLRERGGDIPVLAAHFVDKVCRAEELPSKWLAPEAVERLCAFSWPGNVRQLESAVEMAVAMSGRRAVLTQADFPLPLMRPREMAGLSELPSVSIPIPEDGLDYEQTMAGIERGILEQALRKTGGNKKAAADMLRLKRTTLSAKVRSLEGMSVCN